jgi:hypothetical protein
MAKSMKKCSSSLAIKEIQMKTILRFHLTTVKMGIINNTNNNKNAGENVGRNTSTFLVGK